MNAFSDAYVANESSVSTLMILMVPYNLFDFPFLVRVLFDKVCSGCLWSRGFHQCWSDQCFWDHVFHQHQSVGRMFFCHSNMFFTLPLSHFNVHAIHARYQCLVYAKKACFQMIQTNQSDFDWGAKKGAKNRDVP